MGPSAEPKGRYQVIKHLASGGMAKVLLARATGIEGFERYVVMKQIHPERARDPNVVKAFIDEARVSAQLHHHNIVQVTDIGQEGGEYFIAMEYVHGEDVRSLLTRVSGNKQLIPIEHVLTIVISVASALHYAHELRGPDRMPLEIVHRDVSPANILVGYDGTVKVVDFGIAKAAARSVATESGSLKGKIAYMPPEQCLGLPVDRRGDVFSLGIVLYELYTLRRLFKGASDFLTMNKVVQGDFKPPSVHRPEIPPELERIMLKALSATPADRYQTADELRLALQKFATAAKIQTSTTELADYLVEQFGRRPEPWLAESDDEPILANADFEDPSDSHDAVVAPARLQLPVGIPTPQPDSLFARLRRTTIKAPDAPASDADRAMLAAVEWGGVDNAPTTASGTPLAWEPDAPAETTPKPRRRGLIVVGSAAVIALLAIIVIASSGGGDDSSASKREPTPAASPVADPALAPAAPPAAPAAAAEPIETAVGSGSDAVGSGSDAVGSGSDAPSTTPVAAATATKTSGKKRPVRVYPKRQKKYDPKSLFPK